MHESRNFPRYLGGREVNFGDKEATSRFLQTQALTYRGFRFFKRVHLALELRKTSQGTISCLEHADRRVREVGSNINLPDVEWEEHEVFFLVKCEQGPHTIGGEKPRVLQMPTHPSLKTPFQYIGCIDGSDPYFTWLGVPQLHIIFPVYECNYGIYLDWTNPFAPMILNPQTFDPAWDIKVAESMSYEPVHYCTTQEIDVEFFENNSDDKLLCGVPIWYQAPDIPVCPRTGEVLKYVCTINSDHQIKIKQQYQIENLPCLVDHLCFGDHGWLFVFYHPGSKIMHVQSQFF
jgi:hypothetical protein